MKVVSVNGEVLVSAADRNILNKNLREGKLHLKVDEEFYGNVTVNDETFLSALNMCTIANLVGNHVVDMAIEHEFVDPENIITICGVKHAQYAKLLE
ncbi:MAG: DUF424 family protein [Candidatus Thermoplasmatota archaeon]|nr:DUF424 family protein [Candidatus Thermoplasmatota archaeon]MCL5665258.1 DUF424 family protein [Candidatus Thermoplasmatota archaeon]